MKNIKKTAVLTIAIIAMTTTGFSEKRPYQGPTIYIDNNGQITLDGGIVFISPGQEVDFTALGESATENAESIGESEIKVEPNVETTEEMNAQIEEMANANILTNAIEVGICDEVNTAKQARDCLKAIRNSSISDEDEDFCNLVDNIDSVNGDIELRRRIPLYDELRREEVKENEARMLTEAMQAFSRGASTAQQDQQFQEAVKELQKIKNQPPLAKFIERISEHNDGYDVELDKFSYPQKEEERTWTDNLKAAYNFLFSQDEYDKNRREKMYDVWFGDKEEKPQEYTVGSGAK